MQAELAKGIVRLPQTQIAMESTFVGFIAVIEGSGFTNIVFNRVGQPLQVGVAHDAAQRYGTVLVISVDFSLPDVNGHVVSGIEYSLIPAQYRQDEVQGKSREIAANFSRNNNRPSLSPLLAKNNKRLGKRLLLMIIVDGLSFIFQ